MSGAPSSEEHLARPSWCPAASERFANSCSPQHGAAREKGHPDAAAAGWRSTPWGARRKWGSLFLSILLSPIFLSRFLKTPSGTYCPGELTSASPPDSRSFQAISLFPLPRGVKVERDACPVLGWCCPCPCLLTAASSLVMGVLTLWPRCVHLGGLGGVGVSVPATGSPQLLAPVASHASLAASIWVSSPWGQPCQVGSWKALLALLPSWGPCDSQKPTPS